MQLYKARLKKFPVFTFGLTILVLLAWASVGLGADTGILPAQDWNRKQLKQIKVPAGDNLTFAVLGDNRSNPAVFEQVLKRRTAIPAWPSPLIWGIWWRPAPWRTFTISWTGSATTCACPS